MCASDQSARSNLTLYLLECYFDYRVHGLNFNEKLLRRVKAFFNILNTNKMSVLKPYVMIIQAYIIVAFKGLYGNIIVLISNSYNTRLIIGETGEDYGRQGTRP